MTAEALSADFLAATRPAGLIRDAEHRYYLDGEGPIPSVTTIIGIIDKPALVSWAKRETAASAVRNLDLLNRMVKDSGQQATVDWLKTIPGYIRDTAADVGTRVHSLAEAMARGQEVPATEVELPYIIAYRNFLADKSPRFLAAEEMVVSTRHGFAGTLDFIAEIDGQITLGDVKTGTNYYRETALQLAAYRWADFIGRPGITKHFRIPKVERTVVLHLRPDAYPKGYALVPYEIDRDTFEAFLAAKRLYDWTNGQGKIVIGKPEKGDAA